MELENELVRLRKMTVEDTDKIITWRNSPSVMQRFLYRKPLTREDHLHWIHAKVDAGLVVQFIITICANGQEIGSTYLRDIDHAAGTAEFGIFIGDTLHAGCGYGSAAQKLTLQYAAQQLGLQKIRARILEDNEASVRMHLRNGFRMLPGEAEEMILDGEKKRVIFLVWDADKI